MAVDITPSFTEGNVMYLKEGVSDDDIIKVSEIKGLYRKLKRIKKEQHDTSETVMLLDDDETAVISCCLKKGKIIVWRPVLIRKYNVNMQKVAILAYLCATREGIFCYPAVDIRELLLKEGDKVAVLNSWKEDRRISREQISEMIEAWKKCT